jgi:SAM-dependent methyltransferase
MDQVRLAYASVADRYIELFGTIRDVDPDDLALIGRHLGGRPGPVLDLGCGPGHLTDHLRGLGVDATGVDLVPEFIDHARATHPDGRYEVGSLEKLAAADHSVAGILAWYSLIHLPPDDLPGVLAEFRRAIAPAGAVVLGFFEGAEVASFDHKVMTAYRYPVDGVSELLARASFTEVERLPRAADDRHRAHFAIAALAADR